MVVCFIPSVPHLEQLAVPLAALLQEAVQVVAGQRQQVAQHRGGPGAWGEGEGVQQQQHEKKGDKSQSNRSRGTRGLGGGGVGAAAAAA